jgi:hypothetical protein
MFREGFLIRRREEGGGRGGEMGRSGRSLGHWGMPLKGIVGFQHPLHSLLLLAIR